MDCFLQDIRLEAITQPGELFYDEEWGWGLLEFIQAEDDEMTRLEIGERIKEKLRRRSEIKADTVTTEFLFSEDILQILVRFQFVGSEEEQQIEVAIDRVRVEVRLID